VRCTWGWLDGHVRRCGAIAIASCLPACLPVMTHLIDAAAVPGGTLPRPGRLQGTELCRVEARLHEPAIQPACRFRLYAFSS
jgi:hypothetical protein